MAEVRIEGLDGLEKNLSRFSGRLTESARKGLASAGMQIVADAQQNLRRNRTNNTGLLSQSGKVQVTDGGDAVEAGFFSPGQQGYAEYVENGRRAGKMPPVKMLQEWAYKKLRVGKDQARSAGYLIARKIARKGTRPQPFMRPAVERNMDAVEKAVSAAAREAGDV